MPAAGSESIGTNLVQQPGRRARRQSESFDLPGPVTLREARASEFPRLGERLESLLDGQRSRLLSVRGAELGHDFVSVRDQHDFASLDQADVLG